MVLLPRVGHVAKIIQLDTFAAEMEKLRKSEDTVTREISVSSHRGQSINEGLSK